MENHAALACRSAIQMKKREMELVQNIMNPDGQFCNPLTKLIEGNVVRRERPLYTRLGINSGDMVVGFMGTPAKMDYTIMGNAVNLAARLEGVNKQYDTKGILISEYTREHIGDEFIIRPLSRVTVVGIPVPLRLYELMEIRSEATAELLDMIKVWESAFENYEKKNFAGAKTAFEKVYQNDPEDKAAKLYIERCGKFASAPPPADWDGVDNLTEK
jgi:adenylate cyclase